MPVVVFSFVARRIAYTIVRIGELDTFGIARPDGRVFRNVDSLHNFEEIVVRRRYAAGGSVISIRVGTVSGQELTFDIVV